MRFRYLYHSTYAYRALSVYYPGELINILYMKLIERHKMSDQSDFVKWFYRNGKGKKTLDKVTSLV